MFLDAKNCSIDCKLMNGYCSLRAWENKFALTIYNTAYVELAQSVIDKKGTVLSGNANIEITEDAQIIFEAVPENPFVKGHLAIYTST